MAVRWPIKEEKVFRISIKKLLKGSRRERKKYHFHMNVKWTNTRRSYCSAGAFPSCFLSALFFCCSEHSALNDYSFTQWTKLVKTPVQFLVSPWCGCRMIPYKWALLDIKELSKKHKGEEEKNILISIEFHQICYLDHLGNILILRWLSITLTLEGIA